MTYLSPHIKTIVFKLGLTICLFFAGLPLSGQNAADNPNLESFNVTINFYDVGSYIFPAFYEDPDVLYLPAADLMNLLKIVTKITSEGQVVKGFVETEDVPYEINLPKRFITFKDSTIKLGEGDAMMDMGTLYLRTGVLEKAFGFTVDFNFRSLTALFKSKFELPVVKLKKREKEREKLQGSENDLKFDTIIPRNYQWIRGGMVDWSVASSQSPGYSSEIRMELGLGAEIFGGETNLLLNWSNDYGMNREQQQYSWRWADNDAKVVKQVQLGRVSSRSIASLLSPVDGFVISNTPTSVRKALGNYRIQDHTEPDWVVELYVNNILISYTRADASGFYTFTIPIMYGTSNMVLRFYGPGGEVRSEEKRFNMPYNMLPSREFEYKISGGALLDSMNSKFGKVEVNYGLSRWLTAGAGVEYLTSIIDNPEIPFVNFTFQPFSSLLITGEYAYKVRTKGTMNLTLFGKSTLEFLYASYTPGQKAIIYNYLKEKSGSLSVPYKIRNFSGYGKVGVRQNVYSTFTYNTGELMLSGNVRSYSVNMSNFMNWTDAGNSNIYANLSMGYKFGKNVTFRPSTQYNYSTNKFISYKAEIESKIFTVGNASLRFENSLLSNYKSINLSFRYDIPFMSSYVSIGYGSKRIQASESVKGSFAFGSGKKYVHIDKRGSVGRCGISVETFVDLNFNGVRDNGEPTAERIKVRCSGGQVFERDNDSIIRIIGLEPFVSYNLLLDESGFENLTWKLPFKSIRVITDPNQFKKISIPILPMGEISGLIADQNGNGIGRILVTFTDSTGNQFAKTLTESDGYFTYIGFKPGKYSISIDSMQLRILHKEVDPIIIDVKPDIEGDIVDAGALVWRNEAGYVEEVKVPEPAVHRPEPKEIILVSKKAQGLSVVKIVPWSMEIAVIYYRDGTYCLQLGAYNNMASAEKAVARIKRTISDISIDLVEENKIVKVRTERATNRIEVIKLARRIQAAGLLK